MYEIKNIFEFSTRKKATFAALFQYYFPKSNSIFPVSLSNFNFALNFLPALLVNPFISSHFPFRIRECTCLSVNCFPQMSFHKVNPQSHFTVLWFSTRSLPHFGHNNPFFISGAFTNSILHSSILYLSLCCQDLLSFRSVFVISSPFKRTSNSLSVILAPQISL